jgi:purine-binding chemotaxis protein CheW
LATETKGNIRHSGLFGSQMIDEQEQDDEIDFKMVTFTLSGKQYGIDIMMVKEIAKFGEFTYVPNTRPYVSGVYNLRGDIISVIDMRRLFNLPASAPPAGEPAEGLILRLPDGLMGMVVDSIERVVGVASENIQPPHPIFADVNLKYISGVIEHDDQLFIILDVERVLGLHDEKRESDDPVALEATVALDQPETNAGFERPENAAPSIALGRASLPDEQVAVDNVAATLKALSGFVVSDLNRRWITSRIGEWHSEYGGLDISNADAADEFLAPFASARSGRFFDHELLSAAAELFSDLPDRPQIWNPGCGQGRETYSLAVALKEVDSRAQGKIWATDNDLMNVSMAPNVAVRRSETAEAFHPYLVEGVSGETFSKEIGQMVLFEFSDILNSSALPPCDVIFCRDVLSYLPEDELTQALEIMGETGKTGALVVVGDHEELDAVTDCELVTQRPFRAYRFA